MHTQISRFADKTMEAAVLLAVLVIPLFFDPYSARVFEGEKTRVLWALALVAAAAWLVRFLETRVGNWSPSFSSSKRQPLIWAAVAIGLVTLLASATSITPRLSLWGSYQRSQGVITTLGYLVLFGATISTFRSRERRQRLVTTLVVASGPIALLAVLQFVGLNPLPLRSIDPSRVFGTLTNPIFLGAFLVLVFPLTLAQIVRYGTVPHGVRWTGIVGYAILLILQLAAAVFSGSRGPLMGLVAGGVLFVFLLGLQTRRRWIPAGMVASAIVLFTFLVILNLPNTPLAGLKSVPVVGRFGQIMSTGSAQVRVLIWQAVVDRFEGDSTRLILGYGPESTHAALLSSYPAELRHLEPERLPDRAHNVFLEALVTTGVLGTAAVIFAFAATLYTGLRGLGWLATKRTQVQWAAITVAGIALGVLVPWLIVGSWTFSGLGVGLGLILAFGTYLFWRLLRPEPGWKPALTDRGVLVTGLLAALAGHLLEVTVGIRVTATEVLFWVLAGLLVVLSTAPDEAAAPPAKSSYSGDGITLTWAPEPAVFGLLGGLMLSTLAFGTLSITGADTSTSSVGRWLLLLGAWGLAGVVWRASPGVNRRPGTGWIYPVVSLGWGGVFFAVWGAVRVAGGDAITLLNAYFVWLLLSAALVAVLLPRWLDEVRSAKAWAAIAYPLLAAVTVGVMAWFVVKPLHADIYLEAADAHAATGQWSQALAFYQKAVDEGPNVDIYHQNMGQAYATAARLVQNPNQREALFQTGERALREAQRLNPVEGTHQFNLAHLYLLWGQAADDPGRQMTLLNQATQLYAAAASNMPNDPRVYTEWGLALQTQGNADAALTKYREALAVDPRDAQAYLHMGALYQQSGKSEQALEMYQQAVELDPERAETYRALADLYRQEGQLMDAVAAQERAAQLRPTDYAIHQNLALLYRDLGQIQNAVAEAELALNYAPPERREALQSFLQSLLSASTP